MDICDQCNLPIKYDKNILIHHKVEYYEEDGETYYYLNNDDTDFEIIKKRLDTRIYHELYATSLDNTNNYKRFDANVIEIKKFDTPSFFKFNKKNILIIFDMRGFRMTEECVNKVNESYEIIEKYVNKKIKTKKNTVFRYPTIICIDEVCDNSNADVFTFSPDLHFDLILQNNY